MVKPTPTILIVLPVVASDVMASSNTEPSFRFQARRGRLDWRSLSKLDLSEIARTVDIDTLEKHLAGITFADVTKEGAQAAPLPARPQKRL